jgi:hypothetical protein
MEKYEKGSWMRFEKFLMIGKGGGDQNVENLCACFRCFVACILPVGVEKNKPNPSRKENDSNGK